MKKIKVLAMAAFFAISYHDGIKTRKTVGEGTVTIPPKLTCIKTEQASHVSHICDSGNGIYNILLAQYRIAIIGQGEDSFFLIDDMHLNKNGGKK